MSKEMNKSLLSKTKMMEEGVEKRVFSVVVFDETGSGNDGTSDFQTHLESFQPLVASV